MTHRFSSRRNRRMAAAAAAFVALVVLAWLWRPLGVIHGTLMLFYKHPALVTLPVLFGGVLFAAHVAVKALTGTMKVELVEPKSRPEPPQYPHAPLRTKVQRTVSPARPVIVDVERPRRRKSPWRGPFITLAAAVTLAFVFALCVTDAWTQTSIARSTSYGKLDPATLAGGEVRVKPFEVAENQLDSNFTSPTEDATNVHIVKVDGKLVYTGARDPQGLFRKLSKPTAGVISADAEATGPGVKVHGRAYDAEFKYGPGMQVSQNIRWQIYKRVCYRCDVQEIVALPTKNGPVMMASLVRYKLGLLSTRPVFGGVVLIHPDGRLRELSPKQAAADPLVAGSGRMFPEKLARRIADAYKYRHGLINRVFTHRDHYEVADTESNKQPYLQDFAELGLQWVTTLKPRGKTTATGMVMTTDAVTGETRAWKVPDTMTLIGNTKALGIVQGERLGVNFGSKDAPGPFKAIEPRQVFPGGRLQFLISVVPSGASRVTLSVIVDAERQQVVKVFPATERGDADLIEYLNTGQADGYDFDGGVDSGVDPTTGEPTDPTNPAAPAEPTGKLPAGTDAKSTLRRLLEQNLRDQKAAGSRLRDLKAQQADLERLLQTAEKLNDAQP